MEGKSLVVVTPRTFRSGETAVLKITTRNIESLHFTAYKLNAESYFRKKSGLENVESLDIGLVAPDAAWTAPVPGYARYKPSEAEFELKKLELPGRLRRQGHRRKNASGDDARSRQRSGRHRQDLARPDSCLRPGHENRQGPRRRSSAGFRRRPDRSRRRDRGRRRAAA